jgi:hypothetical protein
MMGGFGSGRPSGFGTGKVEACRSIDVNWLHRDGCLSPGWAGAWQWTRNGEEVAAVNMHAERSLPLVRQVGSRDDKRPTLSELRWAAEIEQAADVAIFLYREAYYLERQRGGSIEQQVERDPRLPEIRHELEVDVAKQRGGSTGALTMWTDVSCAAVRDMAPAGMTEGEFL